MVIQIETIVLLYNTCIAPGNITVVKQGHYKLSPPQWRRSVDHRLRNTALIDQRVQPERLIRKTAVEHCRETSHRHFFFKACVPAIKFIVILPASSHLSKFFCTKIQYTFHIFLSELHTRLIVNFISLP
jgi:hypothetical protein